MEKNHHLSKIEAIPAATSAFVYKFHTIATETIDYSRKYFADSAAFLEKLSGAKSIDSALKIQSDYAKEFQETFIAQAKKVGALYSELGKEAFKPIAGVTAKLQSPKD